jgi:hypothetical protein
MHELAIARTALAVISITALVLLGALRQCASKKDKGRTQDTHCKNCGASLPEQSEQGDAND